MTTVQAPSTANVITNDSRLTNIRNDIWLQSLTPQFAIDFPYTFPANKLRLSAKRSLGSDRVFIIPFRILDTNGDAQNIFVYFSTLWDIDISAAGVNLTTLIGGRVDGLALEANRNYLIWAFYDASKGGSGFQGIGITRKPYSTFSAITSGSKGSTATITVTNAFQFTINSLVIVRNTVGTLPLYEYNLGTILSITNSTTITVLMQNTANYGTNITAATGGEVAQWENFRPWVVGSGSQVLYSNTYALLGEIITTGTNIARAHTITDEFRELLRLEIFNSTATIATPTAINLFRYLPPWVDQAALQFVINGNATAVNISSTVYGSQIMFLTSNNSTYTGAGHLMNTGHIYLEKFGNIMVTKNNSVNGFIYLLGYRIAGGMRP